MSMLLGPLSETMSSVSWRDCALAGDQIAGTAGRTLPAASAVIDCRNSRRFIETSQWERISAVESAKVVPKAAWRLNPPQPTDKRGESAIDGVSRRAMAAAGNCIQFAIARLNDRHLRFYAKATQADSIVERCTNDSRNRR